MKNIYRIVAKFEYNNNKYFITMVNDDKIVVVKYDENKNISTNFSDEEYEMLNTVYNSLLIDKEQSVYIEDLDVNQNKYKIYFDPNSKNYFWDLISGNNNEECNKYLNFKFNHMTGIHYLKEEKEENADEKLEQLLKDALEQLNELTSKTERKVEMLKNKTQQEEKQEDNDENNDETITENDNELISIRPEEIEELNQATAEENKLEFKLELDEDGETIESVIQKAIQAVRKKKAKDKKIKELNEVIDELNEIKNHGSRVEIRLEISEKKETVESILQKAIEAVKGKIERLENGDFTEEQELEQEIEQELEQEGQNAGEAKEEKDVENEIDKQENVEDNTNKDKREEDEIETKKYYRKLVKFKKIIIPIMVSTTMLLAPIVDASILGAQGKKENKIGKGKVGITYTQNQDYDYSNIEKAIDSNKNLTDAEKEFIKKFKIVFDEDYEYMDLDLIQDRLKSLKINYNNEKDDENAGLAGTYNELTNEITMNNAKKFEDVNKADFSHELFHVWQNCSHRYIMELINEGYKREKLRQMKDEGILEEKYFEDNTQSYANFGNGYADHIYIYYILASMMDKESIKKYQYTCDDKIIVSELCRIDKNNNINIAKENAYHLLECIDNLRSWDDETKTYKINTSAEEECKKRLNYYFKQKNGKGIEEDLNCVIHKMYYDEITYKALEETLTGKVDKLTGSTDKILGPWKTVLPKTYLSDDHKEASITFSTPELITINVTDKLSQEYSKNYERLLKEKQKGTER